MNPWLRLFARIFDYWFFYLLLIISFSHISLFTNDLLAIEVIASLLLIPCLWIPFEAVLIRIFGTTPGKKIIWN